MAKGTRINIKAANLPTEIEGMTPETAETKESTNGGLCGKKDRLVKNSFSDRVGSAGQAEQSPARAASDGVSETSEFGVEVNDQEAGE